MTYTTWKLYAYFLWFNEFRIPFFSDWSKYCCSLCQNNPRSNQKNSKFTIRNSEFGRSFGEEHKNCWKILNEKLVSAWLYIIHRLQLMQKYRQKNPVKWQKCHKKFPTALCACWHLALATMPSGRHPIIAFFEAIKPCRMEDMTIEARQVRFAVWTIALVWFAVLIRFVIGKTMNATRAIYTKVPILKECHFGKVKLWHVEHFWTYFVFIFGRDYWIQ